MKKTIIYGVIGLLFSFTVISTTIIAEAAEVNTDAIVPADCEYRKTANDDSEDELSDGPANDCKSAESASEMKEVIVEDDNLDNVAEFVEEDVKESPIERLTGVIGGECGYDDAFPVTWTIEDDELVISGTGSMADYVYINDGIGKTAPWRDYSFSKLTIETGVRNVGRYAFYGCSNLKEVSLADGIEGIGKCAFEDCTGLTSIIIPESTTYVNSEAFKGCSNIEQLVILSKTVDPQVHSTVAGWLQEMGSNKLKTAGPVGSGCNIEFGWDEEIPGSAFKGCRSLTEITLPDGITSIGTDAFYNCKGLEAIHFPKDLTSIGEDAFYGCSNIVEIVFPEALSTLGAGAFDYCGNFEKVVLPKALTIGVFKGTGGVGSSKLKTAGPIGSGCNIEFGWDEEIPDGGLNASSLESVLLPEGLKSIGNNAFSSYCLTEISIPDTVISIGDNAFSSCKFTSLDIPDGLEYLGAGAFRNSDISPIVLPETLTTFSGFPFGADIKSTGPMGSGCDLEFQWTETIPDNAFKGGYRILTFIIPESVTQIGSNAFEGCSELSSIRIPDGVTEIGSAAFKDCESLERMVIPEGTSRIGAQAFEGCECLSEISIPNSVTSIGSRAFCNCSRLREVVLPIGLSVITSEMFTGCLLDSVTIPCNVDRIFPSAFYHVGEVYYEGSASAWENITIYSNNYFGNMHYGNNLASGICGDHAYWTIDSSGVLRIRGRGTIAFTSNPNLGEVYQATKIEISEGITEIKSSYGLKNLSARTILLPTSLVQIPDDCFSKSNNLQRVDYYGTEQAWNDLVINNSTLRQIQVSFSLAAIFDANGGNVDVTSKKITKDNEYGELPEPSERYGYEFTGWYLSPDGNDQVTPTTIVSMDMTHKLYAHWDAVDVMVRFDTNGVTTDMEIDSIAVRFGNSFGSLPQPTSEGKDFNGWYNKRKNGYRITSEMLVNSTKEITLYAYWSVSEYTVSFVTYDDEFLPDSKKVPYNEKYGMLPIPAQRIGYDFDGWYTEPEGRGTRFTDESVVKENLVLYASWISKGFSISGLDQTGYIYTGKAITIPTVKVYFQEQLLRLGTDYLVSYSNNTNIGNNAMITITGKGNFSGNKNETFSINAKNISDTDVLMSEISSVVYNKKSNYTPVPTITFNKKKLIRNTDFVIAYYEDEECNGLSVTPKECGTNYAKVSGIKNFTGNRILPFTIARTEQIPISRLKVDKIADKAYENGTQITPKPVVKNGRSQLQENTHYTLSWGSNSEIGIGTVTLTGIEPYIGTRTITFNITGLPMNKVSVSGIPKTTVYDGGVKEPIPTLYYKNGKNTVDTSILCTTQEAYDLLDDDEKKEVGCIVSYSNNINAGTATVTLKGIHGCSGTVNKTFKILPFEITGDPDELFNVVLNENSYPYAKGGVKPVPSVTFKGEELTPGKDYTLAYTNNKALNSGIGKNKPIVKVIGKGNFKGTDVTATFGIIQADMRTAGIKVVANDVVFQNKAGKWVSNFTVVGPDGTSLNAGTDYDKKNIEFINASTNKPIDAKSIVYAGTMIKVKVNGKGAFKGSAEGTYRIISADHDIGKLTAVLEPKTYAGGKVSISKNDIVWKSGKKEVTGVEFEIDKSTYKNNINKGKASVVVRGVGDWGGTKTVTFSIVAKDMR